jgi:hypothetical protein
MPYQQREDKFGKCQVQLVMYASGSTTNKQVFKHNLNTTDEKPKVYQQSSLITTISKNSSETECQLSLSINRLCIVYRITKRMPSSSHFKNVLNYARQTNSSYKPPTISHEMGSGFLEANYFAYQLESVNKLLTKVDYLVSAFLEMVLQL